MENNLLTNKLIKSKIIFFFKYVFKIDFLVSSDWFWLKQYTVSIWLHLICSRLSWNLLPYLMWCNTLMSILSRKFANFNLNTNYYLLPFKLKLTVTLNINRILFFYNINVWFLGKIFECFFLLIHYVLYFF